MKQGIAKPLRVWSLIILCCAFLITVAVSGPTSSTRAAAQSGPSAATVTTSQDQTEPRPNRARRFFSRVIKVIRHPFRKRVRPISDPPVVIINSSTSMLSFCPPWMHALENCSTSREVQLFANVAADPAVAAKMLYEWIASAGRIRGEGRNVIWDLSDVAEGDHTANVEVYAGHGLIATAATKVTIARCPDCMFKESPCPTINVSCPENPESNQSTTFEAHILGGDPTVNATYTWSVSAGKISGGQGTSKLIVDFSNVAAGSITATVSIGGLDPLCAKTASCTTRTARGVALANCQLF